MAATQPHAFDRAFPRKSLFRGSAGATMLLSILASILLAILLVVLFLIADLLITQGRLSLNTEQSNELSTRTLIDFDPGSETDLGLLPTVWRYRDSLWAPGLADLYTAVPALQSNASALVGLVLLGMLLLLLRGLLAARVRRLSMRAGIDVATRLRRTLHRHALRLAPADLSDTESEHVLDLFTVQMDRLRVGIAEWVGRLARYPFEVLLLIAMALAIDWRLALQCLIPLAACWFVVHRERLRIRDLQSRAADRASDEIKLLAEGFRKSRLVQGYGMQELEHAQFQSHLDRFGAEVLFSDRGQRWSQWGRGAVALICASVVLALVGIKVLEGGDGRPGMTFSSAIWLLATFACTYRPLEELWMLPEFRARASAAADITFRYLNRLPSVSQAVGAKFLQPVNRSIQFESVMYAADGRQPLLKGIDLKLSSGETIAVVSLNLLEMRALAYLLPRFIEPNSGRILFDGQDIAWATLESLRVETVYVGGNDPFFSGTVLENIRCGSSRYTLQAVTEAAKISHAHNFILKLPQGYETVLGERGEDLDAGQAYRLGLARAAVRDPAVLIIEEPPAALDDDTKALLDDAYVRLATDRTMIFLPTRLSTVRKADRVVFLHDGRVEAIGVHDDLLRNCPQYRHWEYTNFNPFRHNVP